MYERGRSVWESLRQLFQYVWEYVRAASRCRRLHRAAARLRAVPRDDRLLRDLDRRGQLSEAQRSLPPVRLILEKR